MNQWQPSSTVDDGFSSKWRIEQDATQVTSLSSSALMSLYITRMWVFLDDLWRCNLTNVGCKIREFQVLETHLNCMRAFTGTHDRISTMSSSGSKEAWGISGYTSPMWEENPNYIDLWYPIFERLRANTLHFTPKYSYLSYN